LADACPGLRVFAAVAETEVAHEDESANRRADTSVKYEFLGRLASSGYSVIGLYRV